MKGGDVLVDRLGEKYGDRTVIRYLGRKRWLNRCCCGREFINTGSTLQLYKFACTHSADARFDCKVTVATSGCHEWTSFLDPCGYGRFFVNGKPMLAHRFAWVRANGPVPDGLQLDHLCRNRKCVNVAHLEPVTHYENMRRGDLSKSRKFKDRDARP